MKRIGILAFVIMMTMSLVMAATPEFTSIGFNSDGLSMVGTIESGYILETTNDNLIDHLIQFSNTTTVSEPLTNTYFPLYLVNSTVPNTTLKSYYDTRGTPEPFLTYLKDAVDSINPFVYISGNDVKLVDAAKHDLIATDVDMTIPDNYPLGTYTVKGTIQSLDGNTSEITLIIIVSGDREAPVISLIGDNNISVWLNSPYEDLGVSISDNKDLNLSPIIVNTINSSLVGNYTVTYSVSDLSGNVAIPVTRNVFVIADTEAPVISIIGDINTVVEQNSIYNDLGVSITDNKDTNGTYTINNTVDTSILGNYSVTYTVTDSSGNTAIAIRNVEVREDITKPEITLIGDSLVEIEVGTEYVDEGVIVNDNFDSNLTIITINNVNSSLIGNYTITYDVTDSHGNIADQVTRQVKVLYDLTLPVISLIGSNSVTVYQNEAYNELGATAFDVKDNATCNITIVSDINTSSLGNYTVTYFASDLSGNVASIVRDVFVITKPVVSHRSKSVSTHLKVDTSSVLKMKSSSKTIREIEIFPKVSGYFKIEPKDLSSKPSLVTPVDKVLKYIELKTTGVSDSGIKSAKIKFEYDAKGKDIVLMRFHNGTWSILETKNLGKNIYEAITPGFSVFAIAERPIVSVIIPETPKENKKDPIKIDVEPVNNIEKETNTDSTPIDKPNNTTKDIPKVDGKVRTSNGIGIILFLVVLIGGSIGYYLYRNNIDREQMQEALEKARKPAKK